jgi:hypothetical protein
MSEVVGLVRVAASSKLLFLPHAIRQMARPDRTRTVDDVRNCIFFGEVIEDYPEDVRGRSCLMLGSAEPDRPIHVVCAPKVGYLSIITAYQPDLNEWNTDWKTRRLL